MASQASRHLSLPEPGELLFAYGSLKRGGQYHAFLADHGALLIGTGSLASPYPLLLAEYPCLLDEPGKGFCVRGEVYRILTRDNWQRLDMLEGHPEEYRRRLEPVRIGAETVSAWTYFYLLGDQLDASLEPVPEFRIEGP